MRFNRTVAVLRSAIEPLESRLLLTAETWIGGTGSWNDPTMWNGPGGGHVPVSGDNAVITAPGSVVNVTDNDRTDDISTSAGTTLHIAVGGYLFLDDGGTIAGSLTVDAAAGGPSAGEIGVGYNTPLSLSGTTTMDGLFYQGNFTNTGTLNIDDAAFNLSGTLTNDATTNITGGLAFGQNLDLINAASGTINLLDDTGLSGNGTIANSGKFALTGGTGTASITGVQLQDLGGTISVQSGTLSDKATAYFESANFTVASGAAFAFDPISVTDDSDNFLFSGTSSGSGAGHLQFDGGTIYPGAPGAQATSAILNFPSGLAQLSGTAIDANSQDGAVQEVTNDGYLNFVGSAQHGNLGLFNQGTIQVSGTGDVGLSSSTFTNEASGILDFTADASFISFGGNSTLINDGTFEKTGGSGTSSIDFNGSDSGTTVDAQIGTIDFPAGYSFDNTDFIAAAGATISLDSAGGGTQYVMGGTITGSGAGHFLFADSAVAPGASGIQVATSILNFPAGFAQVSGGYFASNPQNGSVTEITNAGFLNYTGSIEHGGMGLINQGTIDVSGTGNIDVDSSGGFTNSATGILNFQTDAGITNPGGNTGFSNEGLIEKTGGSGTSVIGITSIGFSNTGGSFNVQSGTISLQNGGGSFSFAVGSINVATGASLDFNNSASIYATGSFSSTGGGTVTFTSGSWQGYNGGDNAATPSTFDFSPGAFIDQGGEFVSLPNDINAGVIEFKAAESIGGLQNNGTLLFPDAGPLSIGNLTNNVGGVINFQADTAVNGYSNLTNDGTIVKSGGTGTISFENNAYNFINDGTIRSASGTILLPGSRSLFEYFTNINPAGSILEADAGATITIDQDNLTENDGTIILNGTGSTINGISDLATNVGTLEVLNGASFTDTVSLANTGTLDVGSALTIDGNLTESQASGTPTPAAPDINFEVSALPSTSGAPDLSVTGSTTLAGNLSAQYTNGFGSNGSQYTVANFTSASGGSFASTTGVGPAFTVALHPNTIVLNGANLPIVNAKPDTYSVQNGSLITVNAAAGVLANDSDPNSRTLTASLLTNPTHGFVSLNADGSFTYVPNESFTGTDSFTYYATDGAVTSHATTVTLNVGLAQPVFSNLTAPTTISYGTPSETIGGTIGASGVYPPAGETVAVTLNGVTQNATIGANGAFSTTFNTSTLPVSLTAYSVSYAYAGDSSFLSASNTATTSLTVDKATASVHLGNLAQTYTGSPESATATTTPAGLAVTITYTQNNVAVAAPTNAGSYAVTATINDANYQGSTSGTLVISNSGTSLTFSGTTSVTYDGGAHYVTATTTAPAGLSGVSISYIENGTPVSNPTNAGTYVATASLNNPDYTASPIQENLVIAQATPTFSGLSAPSSITAGAASVTFSGTIAAGSVAPSAGESVAVTLNGVTQNPLITGGGAFSTTFNTTSLPYSSVPYTVSYSFAGDTNFAAASNTTATTLTVNSSSTAPIVYANPVNDTVTEGTFGGIAGLPAFFSFFADASGTPNPTVQWQISTNGGSSFTNIAGATSQSYSSTATTADSGYEYRAVFTNSAGTATSTAAVLTVNGPAGQGTTPVVTLNPISQTVTQSTTATFTAAASGTPTPTVQWQVSPTNGGYNFGTFSNIAGATSTSYSVVATAANTNYEYRAVFTNSAGSSDTSAATLSEAIAPVVTQNPTTQNITAGGITTFSATATGLPAATVQWQGSASGAAGTFVNLPSADFTSTQQAVNVFIPNGVIQTQSILTLATTAGYRYVQAVFTNSVGSATTTVASAASTAPSIILNPVSQSFSTSGSNPAPTVTLTAAAGGTPIPSVQWQGSTTGAAGSFVNLPAADFTSLSGTSFETTQSTLTIAQSSGYTNFRAVFTNIAGSATTTTAIVSAISVPTLTAPAITTNPISQSVAVGQLVTFTAAASGTPLPTVQWQGSATGAFGSFVNLPAADFTSLSGTSFETTQSTLTIAQSSGYTNFRAVFTNIAGSATTTTAIVSPISVPTLTAPAITTNPISQSVTVGQLVTFTAAASGTPPPTVQWQESPNGGFTFINIAGATSTTYSFTAAAGENGFQYRALFTNSAGATPTSAATLAVGIAPVITANPSNATLSASAAASADFSFTAAASGTPTPSVQWQISTNGGASFTNITTGPFIAFGATLDVIGSVSGDNGYKFRAVFTNTFGSATTTPATLTIAQPPVITTNPLSQSIAAGQRVSFGSNATNATSVVWQVSTNGGITFANIAGATGIVYAFTTAIGENGYEYRAVFSNAGGSAATSAATLSVGIAPVITTNPTSETLNFPASQTAAFSFNATASGAPTPSVQWQISTNGGASFSNVSSGQFITVGNLLEVFGDVTGYNHAQFRAVFTNAYGSATTSVAVLTINTPLAIVSGPSSVAVDSGTTATFTATAQGNTVPTVQWQVSSNGGASYANIAGATSTTYSFTATSTQNNYKYRAVFTNSQGTVITVAATLTVVYVQILSGPTLVTVNGVQGYATTAIGGPYLSAVAQATSNNGATYTNLPASDYTLSYPAANEITIFVPLSSFPAGDKVRGDFFASAVPF